jgi:hypothetical protein
MVVSPRTPPARLFPVRRLAAVVFCLPVLALLACNSISPGDPSPLDQASIFINVDQLRPFDMTQDEVQQLILTREAGIMEEDCVELVRLARRRGRPFNDGQAIAGLVRSGLQQSSVMTLARLDQLGVRAGEAQAMKLAGLSDEIVLALARRRNAGQRSLSSAKAAELRNAGLTNPQILSHVTRGTTDAQADAIIAQRNRAAGGSRFVRQQGTRRR